MKISYTAEGSSTEHYFALLVVASNSSKGPIDELEALLVFFLLIFIYLFERKRSLKFKRKTTKSVKKNSKGKQTDHKVSLLSINIESSGNFGINK